MLEQLHQQQGEGRRVDPTHQHVGHGPQHDEDEHQGEHEADVVQAVGRHRSPEGEEERRQGEREQQRAGGPESEQEGRRLARASDAPRALRQRAPGWHPLEEHQRQRQGPADDPRYQYAEQRDDEQNDEAHGGEEGRRLLGEIEVDVVLAQQRVVDDADSRQKGRSERERASDQPQGEHHHPGRATGGPAQRLRDGELDPGGRARADRHEARLLEGDDGERERGDGEHDQQAERAEGEEEDLLVGEDRPAGEPDTGAQGQSHQGSQDREGQELVGEVGHQQGAPAASGRRCGSAKDGSHFGRRER